MAVATAATATGVVAMFLCITEAAGGLGATAEGESPMQELRLASGQFFPLEQFSTGTETDSGYIELVGV